MPCACSLHNNRSLKGGVRRHVVVVITARGGDHEVAGLAPSADVEDPDVIQLRAVSRFGVRVGVEVVRLSIVVNKQDA